MKYRSNINTWRASDGSTYTSAQVDRLTRVACKKTFEIQRDKHGFNFCVDCKKNSIQDILDPSHTVSVKKAKETGRVELCWYIPNIPIRCRTCHNKLDKLYIGKP